MAKSASIIDGDGGHPYNTNMLIVNNILINSLVTRFYFIMIITWSLAMVVCCEQKSNDNDDKIHSITGNIDHHVSAAE